MSLTIDYDYTLITSSMPSPPCTLEIKFSTAKPKYYNSTDYRLLIGNFWRKNTEEYEIAWGIMVSYHYWDKYISVKIDDKFSFLNPDYWGNSKYDGYYHYGKPIDDGEPHTIRMCIDGNSKVSIYQDGKCIIRDLLWNPPLPDYGGRMYLCGTPHPHGRIILETTTLYYVKIAEKCITDSHINKSDCSAYWTWNSDGYRVLNGVPDNRVDGICDDITLDYIRHSTYKHDLDLYGIKK